MRVKVLHEQIWAMLANARWWYTTAPMTFIISHAFVVPSLLTLMLESWKGVHNVLKKKLNSFSGGIQALLQRLDIAGYCVAMNNTAVIVTHHSRHCMQPSVEIPGAKWKMLLVEYCA